jgi:hypothetical protein
MLTSGAGALMSGARALRLCDSTVRHLMRAECLGPLEMHVLNSSSLM